MKAVSASVAFKDPLGVVVASGKLILDLTQPAEVTSGGGLITPTRVVLSLTSGGLISSINIIFNDEITPSGTTYHAVLYNSAGSQVADFGQWSFTGASVDLSTMVPSSSSVSYSGAVLLSPTGNQTITNDLLPAVTATQNLGSAAKLWNAFLSTMQAVTATITALTVTTINKLTLTQPATSATLTLINGTTVTGPATTDTIVGKATTDALTNKTLTGATTGNTIAVLNAQGAVAAITGTAADAVVYTYSLPANTIDTTSKGILISCALTHSTGTANPTVKININGVNAVTGNIGTTSLQSVTTQAKILRTAATTGGSMGIATVTGVLNPFSIGLTGLAWTSSQTITVTFNVAATDTVAGVMFLVEQIQ